MSQRNYDIKFDIHRIALTSIGLRRSSFPLNWYVNEADNFCSSSIRYVFWRWIHQLYGQMHIKKGNPSSLLSSSRHCSYERSPASHHSPLDFSPWQIWHGLKTGGCSFMFTLACMIIDLLCYVDGCLRCSWCCVDDVDVGADLSPGGHTIKNPAEFASAGFKKFV